MKIHKARRAENCSGTEQNSSRIRVSEQNFEQNKRFLRALPAGRISHFTSRIYPSLHYSQKRITWKGWRVLLTIAGYSWLYGTIVLTLVKEPILQNHFRQTNIVRIFILTNVRLVYLLVNENTTPWRPVRGDSVLSICAVAFYVTRCTTFCTKKLLHGEAILNFALAVYYVLITTCQEVCKWFWAVGAMKQPFLQIRSRNYMLPFIKCSFWKLCQSSILLNL